VVLDMAMSQFSYGALAAYRQRGEPLPVEGGFDAAGRLTRDARAIEETQRPLPTGYWKGSGLSLMLDMVAAILSGGAATHQIPADPEREAGVSQVFVAIAPPDPDAAARMADAIVASIRGEDGAVRYPGEQVARIRAENLARGVPVDDALWNEIAAL